eukprot:Rmarinus@m.26399
MAAVNPNSFVDAIIEKCPAIIDQAVVDTTRRPPVRANVGKAELARTVRFLFMIGVNRFQDVCAIILDYPSIMMHDNASILSPLCRAFESGRWDDYVCEDTRHKRRNYASEPCHYPKWTIEGKKREGRCCAVCRVGTLVNKAPEVLLYAAQREMPPHDYLNQHNLWARDPTLLLMVSPFDEEYDRLSDMMRHKYHMTADDDIHQIFSWYPHVMQNPDLFVDILKFVEASGVHVFDGSFHVVVRAFLHKFLSCDFTIREGKLVNAWRVGRDILESIGYDDVEVQSCMKSAALDFLLSVRRVPSDVAHQMMRGWPENMMSDTFIGIEKTVPRIGKELTQAALKHSETEVQARVWKEALLGDRQVDVLTASEDAIMNLIFTLREISEEITYSDVGWILRADQSNYSYLPALREKLAFLAARAEWPDDVAPRPAIGVSHTHGFGFNPNEWKTSTEADNYDFFPGGGCLICGIARMTLKFPQLLRFAAEDQMPDDHTCETYKVWNEDPILYVMTCPTVELNKTFDFLENVLKMSRYQAAATITRYRGRLTSETLPSQLDGVLEDVLDLSLHPTRCLCFHYLVETLSLFKRMDDYAVCIREHRKESAKIALADPDALSSTRKKDALEEVERKCEETVLRGIDDIFEWFEAAGVPVGEVERALGIEDVKVETGPADEPAVKKHDDIKEDMCQQLAAERQNIESETIASERADDNDKELGGSGSVGRLESEGASCLGERAEKDKDDSYKVKEGRISYRLRLKIDKKQVPKAIPRFQDVNFFKKRYPVILQALRRQYRETKLAFRSRRLLLVHSWRKVTWRGFEEEVSFESVRVAVGLLMEMGILSYFDIERVLLKVPEMTVRPLQEELSKKMTFVGMIPWCPSASKECSIDHYHRVEAAPKRDVHSLEGVAPCTGGVGCGRCHMGELVCAFPALLDSWASNELPKGSAVEEAQLDWQEPFIHILTKETSVLHACVDVLASEAQLDYRSIGAILSWYPWLPGMGSRAIDAVLDCFSTIGMKPDSRLSHNVLLCLLDLLLAGLEPGTYGFVRRQFREAYAERDNLFDPLEDGGSNNDSEYERELDRQIREEAEKKAGPPPLVFEGVGETTVGRATAAVRFLAEHLGEEDRLLGLTSSIAPKCDTDDNADGDGEENRNECARVENRKPANDHDLQGYTSFFVQIVNLSNMSAESVLTDRIGRGVYRILRRSEWASDASSNVIRHSVRFLRGLGLGTISAILDVYTPAPDLIRIDLERRIQPLIDFLVLYPWPRTVCLRIPPPSRQGVEKTDVITHVHKGTHKRSQLFSARKYPDDDALYCIICRFAALVKQGKLFERAISGKPIKRSDASGSGFSHNGFHVRLLQSDARMTLDPLIAVLMQEGVKSTEEIAKIFVGHPDLFLSSAEDVLDRTEFLRTMGADRVDRLLVTFPKEIFTVDIDRKDERKVAMTLLRAFGASEGEIHELFAEPVQDACVSHSANLSTLLPDAKRLLRECYSRRSSSECANQAMRFQSNTATPDGPREFFDHERHRMVENPNWAMKVKQEKQLAVILFLSLFSFIYLFYFGFKKERLKKCFIVFCFM